jgi:hypothetical protein
MAAANQQASVHPSPRRFPARVLLKTSLTRSRSFYIERRTLQPCYEDDNVLSSIGGSWVIPAHLNHPFSRD